MVSKEKARAYEDVRLSGKTNMFDIERVCRLSGYTLTKQDCKEIMLDYENIMKTYKIRYV